MYIVLSTFRKKIFYITKEEHKMKKKLIAGLLAGIFVVSGSVISFAVEENDDNGYTGIGAFGWNETGGGWLLLPPPSGGGGWNTKG